LGLGGGNVGSGGIIAITGAARWVGRCGVFAARASCCGGAVVVVGFGAVAAIIAICGGGCRSTNCRGGEAARLGTVAAADAYTGRDAGIATGAARDT
jgi:hypothetical protein